MKYRYAQANERKGSDGEQKDQSRGNNIRSIGDAQRNVKTRGRRRRVGKI